MLTAIIVDDEAKGRLALREKLSAYCPGVEIMAEAADGKDALVKIAQLSPNLIFLDIEMPRMNGFEMLNQLQEKNFYIIFTTAYDQYAIRAIKYAAFDYLLKPIDIEELKTAISNVEEACLRAGGDGKAVTMEQVNLLNHNLQHPVKNLQKLAIPTLEGLMFYDIADIIHLEASSNYTVLHMNHNMKVTASRTLKEFEELLPEEYFFRTHHSHLINLNYIKRYIKGDGGQIEMQNGNFVDVARRKKEEFLKIIGQ